MTACDHFVLLLVFQSNNLNMLNGITMVVVEAVDVHTCLFMCVSQVAAFHICSDIYVNYKDQHYKHNDT